MLGLVHHFLAPPSHPIGIDVDGRTLRMAQVQADGCEYRIRAAASKRLPALGLGLSVETVRDALRDGGFAGRDAVLTLPTTAVSGLDQGIARDQKPFVTSVLQTLAGVGLRVHAVRPLPTVLAALTQHLFRRMGESACTTLHLHLAESATLCTIEMAGELKHVGTFDFSKQALVAALAGRLGESEAQAAVVRERLLHAAAAVDWNSDRTMIHRPAAGQLGHPLDAQGGESARLCHESAAMQDVLAAEVRPLLDQLASLRSCFEAPISRVIFSGCEAIDRSLCEQIARGLALPAHIADPILRMRGGNTREMAGGIDRRLPQPAWAAAIGGSIAAGRLNPSQAVLR